MNFGVVADSQGAAVFHELPTDVTMFGSVLLLVLGKHHYHHEWNQLWTTTCCYLANAVGALVRQDCSSRFCILTYVWR